MAKFPSDGDSSSPSSNEQQQAWISNTWTFLKRMGIEDNIPVVTKEKGVYDRIMIRGLLNVNRIERGRITCVFTVKAALTNRYNTLHGGVVATIAETMALACVRSVAGDKDFFLGEMATTFLSATRVDEEVEVDGCIKRHGRNVIVTSVEFRKKKTTQLVYSGRGIFYSMPVASL